MGWRLPHDCEACTDRLIVWWEYTSECRIGYDLVVSVIGSISKREDEG